tara:strand:- start:54763 stop:55059 length:297 start_codon:yes stop_codon:yes gene_type:complete
LIPRAKYHERKSNIYERPTIQHEMWKKELNFYDEALNFLTKRLEEVTYIHLEEKDMLKEVGHFQNQFIIQKQNSDTFLHDINADGYKLVEFAKDLRQL